MRIVIFVINQDKLVIKPLRDENLHKGMVYDLSSDLSQELNQLKSQLASTAQLTENVDYVKEPEPSPYRDSRYLLVFSGKSAVLRALNAIPHEWIQFDHHTTKQKYLTYGFHFSTTISRKNCFASEIPCIEKTNKALFDYLKEEVDKIHSQHLIHSTIISQLIADLAYIENLPIDDVFNTPKYFLALTSLHVALSREMQEKLTVKPYTLVKGGSILAPEYQRVINHVVYLSPSCKSFEPKFIELYNRHVRKHTSVVQANPPLATRQDALGPRNDDPFIKANAEFSSIFFKTLIGSLKVQKREIQQRINSNQWFQIGEKNREKIAAIQEIEVALTSGNNPMEMMGLINSKRGILIQSTSALPGFFRSKVSTAAILDKIPEVYLSP